MYALPGNFMQDVLVSLEKGMTTDGLDAIVPQDLEATAHSVLWTASDSQELTALKLLPAVKAKQIKHDYRRITAYGETRGDGMMTEQQLPKSTVPTFTEHQTLIRLMGEMTETFLLASLEQTISVAGQSGAEAIQRVTLMLSFLKRKNRNIYLQDDSTIRTGATAPRFKGLLQLIREGTDGTSGTSPYGSHVIDMEGAQLTLSAIRNKIAKATTLYGFPNCLITDPLVRTDLEEALDPAQRINLPIGIRPLILGGMVGGFQTQGKQCWFHTDNGLSPIYARPNYRGTAENGSPSAPAVSASAGAVGGSRVSKFNAGDAGNYAYIVTEVKNDRESLGTRYPASASAWVAVTEDQEVTLLLTPSDPNSDYFKVYRVKQNDPLGDGDTDGGWLHDVANSGSGAQITHYDDNQDRPHTSFAFLLTIRSASADFMNSAKDGYRASYELAVENSEKFLRMPDNPQNTVSVVELGPSVGVLPLAVMLPQLPRPMLYSALAMQVRNPLVNFVFKNIGTNAGA